MRSASALAHTLLSAIVRLRDSFWPASLSSSSRATCIALAGGMPARYAENSARTTAKFWAMSAGATLVLDAKGKSAWPSARASGMAARKMLTKLVIARATHSFRGNETRTRPNFHRLRRRQGKASEKHYEQRRLGI